MGMDEVAAWVCGVYIGEDEAVGTFGLRLPAGASGMALLARLGTQTKIEKASLSARFSSRGTRAGQGGAFFHRILLENI
jgi:hypothetical protein